MKDFRKKQMQAAVLLEISKDGRKNGHIIKGAESRLNLDEAYLRLMQNGKQTVGNKELQFILYYIKRDGLADLPQRGIYVENEKTQKERITVLRQVVNEVNSKDFNNSTLLLTTDTMEEIRNLLDIACDNISIENEIQEKIGNDENDGNDSNDSNNKNDINVKNDENDENDGLLLKGKKSICKSKKKNVISKKSIACDIEDGIIKESCTIEKNE